MYFGINKINPATIAISKLVARHVVIKMGFETSFSVDLGISRKKKRKLFSLVVKHVLTKIDNRQ